MQSTHAYSILIVEDNPDLLEFLLTSLPKLGPFVAFGASDGNNGLELAFTSKPDCIVVDVKMPGLDGYQLIRVLRGDQTTADIPLIILTAMAQEQNQFVGLASGADVYLTKPVVLPTLVEAIVQSLKLSSADRTKRIIDLANEE